MPDVQQPSGQPLPNRTIETASEAPDVSPIAVTATQPPTKAPVVGQGPVTANAPLNMAMGAGVVGATQAGFMAVTGGGEVLATSLFLNLVSQLVKDIKWFPEHKGLIVLMLILSFAVGYFVFYLASPDTGDRIANSFRNMANSTMQAIVNYKGDKAAGLNALAPADKEFKG